MENEYKKTLTEGWKRVELIKKKQAELKQLQENLDKRMEDFNNLLQAYWNIRNSIFDGEGWLKYDASKFWEWKEEQEAKIKELHEEIMLLLGPL